MITQTFKAVKPKDVERAWHLIDAKNQILGRISSQAAVYLMGKNKSYYVPYLDTGDYVVITNVREIILTGRKESQKKYFRHSGYPGGLYSKTAGQIRKQKPELLVRKAIRGMLPKTVMGKKMAKKLYVFPDQEHPFKDKFENK